MKILKKNRVSKKQEDNSNESREKEKHNLFPILPFTRDFIYAEEMRNHSEEKEEPDESNEEESMEENKDISDIHLNLSLLFSLNEQNRVLNNKKKERPRKFKFKHRKNKRPVKDKPLYSYQGIKSYPRDYSDRPFIPDPHLLEDFGQHQPPQPKKKPFSHHSQYNHGFNEHKVNQNIQRICVILYLSFLAIDLPTSK